MCSKRLLPDVRRTFSFSRQMYKEVKDQDDLDARNLLKQAFSVECKEQDRCQQ